MLIISKYKEYYDYLAGAKYGIDKKVVLDRRKGTVIHPVHLRPYRAEFNKVLVAICGYIYQGIVDSNNNIYWGDQINAIASEKIDYKGQKQFYVGKGIDMITVNTKPKKTTLNDEENCPILWLHNGDRKPFPKLSDIGIASILPPDVIYTMIYNWLSAKNEFNPVDNRTDIEKLESAGFDKKSSFRHP